MTTREALTASDVEPLAQPATWTSSSTRGTNGTFIADVTGDGKADVVALDTSDIMVYRSHGTFFTNSPGETWSSTAFVGTHGTFFADVTGDGAADAIEVNATNILVRPSVGGSSFGPAQTWSTTAFFGTSATFFADVDGDKKADAITVNSTNIQVRRSTGSGFGAVETWSSTQFVGGRGNYFADVTGDGLADAINISATTVTVRRSTGSGFNTTAEVWSSNFTIGSKATAFADVTGDGTADAIAINTTGVTMQRSGRWYFGTTETLSDVFIASTYASYVGDVTGDGRVDLVNVNSTLPTQVEVRQDRTIPLRVVQLVSSCASAAPDSVFAPLLADANAVYREIGLNFVLQPVSQNPDCPGQASLSHVVLSPQLSDFTDGAGPDSQAVLSKAIPFNPSCNMGYGDFQDLPEGGQIWWVGARCSLPGEALIYMSHLGTNLSNDPGDGKTIILDPGDALNVLNGHFSHELGHYLGLPHSFDVYTSPLDYIDPATGQGQTMAARWDLVSNGTQFFNSRADAATHEMQLTDIEYNPGISTGWFCPSGNPGMPCPFSSLPGGNPPSATLGMPINNNMSSIIYTYLPQTTTFDSRAKGISPRIPTNAPAINTMSYSYLPMDPPNLKRSISSSQIEIIEGVLHKEIRTKYLDATGQILFGGRPSLGITPVTPQLAYQQTSGVATAGPGTLTSNGQHTWTLGTGTTTGGHQVFEWNYRTQSWTSMPGGAYQIALPSDGSDYPWIVTGSAAGTVQRWNGTTFTGLPADPTGGCAHAIAVGPGTQLNNPATVPLWATSCVGPNGDGNYEIAQYTDANGWQWAGGGWGTQLAVDWQGSLWVISLYGGGTGVMIWKATLGANGLPATWAQVPPPSGVVPQILSGGSTQGGSRLPVNFLGTNGHLYTYSASINSWTDVGAPSFAVNALGGSLPYLWLEQTNGQIWYTH